MQLWSFIFFNLYLSFLITNTDISVSYSVSWDILKRFQKQITFQAASHSLDKYIFPSPLPLNLVPPEKGIDQNFKSVNQSCCFLN